MHDLLVTYYGDDLTGSTNSLEALELGGIPTILFLEPPSLDQLARFPNVRAVGLAGVSRTMTPDEMGETLPGAFASLKNLGTPLTHYKVCSTFDSSPEIGSIGRATKLGMRVFSTPLVPVMVGAPKLKRYVVFGNHFATVGETTYRLDRNPTMSKHPITPMDESDLGLHLGKQTKLSMGLIDVRHLAEPNQAIQKRLDDMKADGIEIVILDTLDYEHQRKVGQILWMLGERESIFVVGSSGVEFALADYAQSAGMVKPPEPHVSPGPVHQIVAISGSAARMAANQMQHAFDNGFVGIRLDTPGLTDPQTAESARSQAVQRCAVAGGDTSGNVLRQLGGDVLEFLIPIGAATPLCQVGSHNPNFDGLEIALKGGQLGEIDFFVRGLQGRMT